MCIDSVSILSLTYCICLFARLFYQAQMYLADQLVTQQDDMYAYTSYFLSTLNFSSESKKTYLQTELFYPDTPGGFDQTNPSE